MDRDITGFRVNFADCINVLLTADDLSEDRV